jgi:hypothetical protein
MEQPIDSLVMTNVHVYREIAEAAHYSAAAELRKRRRARDDAESGYVILYDREQQSFKQSLVAIVFAGMYIEARLWLIGCERLGVEQYRKIDKTPLEDRLAALGVEDAALLAHARAYREMRKELVHEKARPIADECSPVRVAQREAASAVALMARVDSALATEPA